MSDSPGVWFTLFLVLVVFMAPLALAGYSLLISAQYSINLVKPIFKRRWERLQSASSTTVRSFPESVKPGGPPRLAEYALHFFLSARDRINIIGDLEEEYRHVEIKFGRRAANIWYWKQVVTSIGPQLKRVIIKWVSIAWVEEWVRRHL